MVELDKLALQRPKNNQSESKGSIYFQFGQIFSVFSST